MWKTDLLSRAEVASILRLRVVTLERWAHRGFGPSFIKMGRGRSSKVLYRVDEVERFLADPVNYRQAAAMRAESGPRPQKTRAGQARTRTDSKKHNEKLRRHPDGGDSV